MGPAVFPDLPKSLRRGLLVVVGVLLLGASAVTPVAAQTENAGAVGAQSLAQPTNVSVVASYKLYTFALNPICLRFNSDNTIVATLLGGPTQPLTGTYTGDPTAFSVFSGAGGSLGTGSGYTIAGIAVMQLRVTVTSTLAIGFPTPC